jgi:hypothetical protein
MMNRTVYPVITRYSSRFSREDVVLERLLHCFESSEIITSSIHAYRFCFIVMNDLISELDSWYPCKPPDEIPNGSHLIAKYDANSNLDKQREVYSDPHPIWSTGKLKYITENYWPPNITRVIKQSLSRHRISGVEVRDLPAGHFLHGIGQQGLFATTRFLQYDVLGEYVGRLVGNDVNGHYVAALENKAHSESLGIDAEVMGNEMRFINSYLNIGFSANLVMRTSYIHTVPHILLICTRDIEPGEEFLLDYGDAYNKAYLTPKESPSPTYKVNMNILPGYEEDDNDSVVISDIADN